MTKRPLSLQNTNEGVTRRARCIATLRRTQIDKVYGLGLGRRWASVYFALKRGPDESLDGGWMTH